MDRLQALSTFVAVARCGGFSAAARDLGTPVQTVSRRISDLEAELGVRLFNRSTRRVELTEAGQDFYEPTRRVLDDLRDAQESVSGEFRSPRGDLTVTAPVAFGRMHLQPVAIEFLRAYPEINLRLLFVDRVVNLLEERVDLALRIAALADSSLVARTVGRIRRVVCASPAYLREHGVPARPDELTAHSCIAWSPLGAATSWWFHVDGADRAVPIRVRMATTAAESAVAAAVAGLGLTQVTSYQAEAGIRSGALVPVLESWERAAMPVSLVYSTSRLVPLKLRAFLDFAAPRLVERLRTISQLLP